MGEKKGASWFALGYRVWGISFWLLVIGYALPKQYSKGVLKVYEQFCAGPTLIAEDIAAEQRELAISMLEEGNRPADRQATVSELQTTANTREALEKSLSAQQKKRLNEKRKYHYVVLVLIVVFMAFVEGYRGFQKGFSPMLVRRAFEYTEVYDRSDFSSAERAGEDAAIEPMFGSTSCCAALGDLVLAPLLVGGLVHGTGRRVLTSWAIVIGVFLLIGFVTRAPQPWRCFINAGVFVGLGWGWLSLLWYTLKFSVRTHVKEGDCAWPKRSREFAHREEKKPLIQTYPQKTEVLV